MERVFQQQTVEQVIDVPDKAGLENQQRTVEQAVSVPTETAEMEPATSTLDREQLDVTRVIRAKAAPRYENSLMRGVRHELERVRFEQAARRRFQRARERSAERQRANRDGSSL